MDLDLGGLAQSSSRSEHVKAHRSKKELQQLSLCDNFILKAMRKQMPRAKTTYMVDQIQWVSLNRFVDGSKNMYVIGVCVVCDGCDAHQHCRKRPCETINQCHSAIKHDAMFVREQQRHCYTCGCCKH